MENIATPAAAGKVLSSVVVSAATQYAAAESRPKGTHRFVTKSYRSLQSSTRSFALSCLWRSIIGSVTVEMESVIPKKEALPKMPTPLSAKSRYMMVVRW